MPSAGSASVRTGIDARELRELRRGLRAIKPDAPEWARAFTAINKRAGDTIAADAGSRLRGRRGSRAARNIKGAASSTGVRLRIGNTASAPFALATVWGARGHTGWYARARYKNSTGRQHPPWVGSSWEVGGSGGPYGVNPAIHDRIDDVMRDWADAVEDLMARFAAR